MINHEGGAIIMYNNSIPIQKDNTVGVLYREINKAEIPDGFENYTTIPEGIFTNNKDIVGISVPNNIREIGRRAFYGCENLKLVVMNSNIEVIDELAFAFCTSLKDINLFESIKEINNLAFYKCCNLSNLYGIENCPLTNIGKRAFFQCKSLTEVNISSKDVNIDKTAFDGCNMLKLNISK